MRIGEAKNRTELIEAVETARLERLERRRGYETVWWNNIALVSGDHHAQWNPNLSSFEDRDPNMAASSTQGIYKKPRLVINHALTVGRTELSKLTKSRPVMEIIANSDEQDDISATKVGRAALDYAEWRFRLPKLRRDALWWMIQTGLGAVYVGWDPLDEKSGRIEYTIDPATGDAVFDPHRERELEAMQEAGTIDNLTKETYALGEVCYKVYSPFQLYPDETAIDFDELKNLITSEVVDVDVVKGLYGRAAKDVTPENNLMLGTMETRMLAKAGVVGGGRPLSQRIESGVQVHTFWLLPNVFRGNRFLRNGVMLRWCGKHQELDFSEFFPYQDYRIPFVFFQHIPSSTTIWPDSVMTHIRGPNLEIDKTVSQLIENKDYMANPMWLVATQHKIKGEIKNVAGAIVRYRHIPQIPPPEPVPGLAMPNQVENLLVGLRNQIMDISGQSEVTRGNVPSGVRSGVAVAYLQEEDDTKIAPTVQTMEEQIALMGSLTLERFSQYYGIERIIRFYRRDGAFDVRKFKGSDLKNNTDVVCQAGSAMPKMKSARQQYALELASLGLINDPRKLMEMLELGEGEPDDTDKAIAQAKRENNTMLHGVWRGQTYDTDGGKPQEAEFERMSAAVPVKKWHNHEIHIAEHVSVMMDEEFDNLAVSHPEITRLFDEHLNMHYQMQQEEAMQQAMALQAAKGAPDGPPTPPGGANGAGTFKTVTGVPDPIAGGAVRTTAQQIRPQGGGS